jgi:hypothetical protein
LLAEEDQPWVQSTGLLVDWRPNQPFDDDDDPDYIYTPEVDEKDYKDELYQWDDITEDKLTVATDNLSDGEEVSSHQIDELDQESLSTLEESSALSVEDTSITEDDPSEGLDIPEDNPIEEDQSDTEFLVETQDDTAGDASMFPTQGAICVPLKKEVIHTG